MSQGHVVQLSQGLNHPERLYVKLKNNAVWVYEKPLTVGQILCIKQGIENRHGKVHLRHIWCANRYQMCH